MGGEVFTKAARRQRAGKLGLPVVQLFAGVGVDGFIIAAMMLGVTNYIAAHAGTVAIMGAGRSHIDEGLRLLIDARKLVPPARVWPADGDIGGNDLHACHTS